MKAERYKELMEQVGRPDSRSLLQALEQVANEVAQEYQQKINELCDWRPIRTAPQDGTVIICASEFYGWAVKMGYWCKTEERWQLFGGEWEPTHWLPAPATPKPKKPASLQEQIARAIGDLSDGDPDWVLWSDRADAVLRVLRHQEPVAWREFDGEGGYDYRSYYDNETFRKDYIKRNGARYASWVEPLYLLAGTAPNDTE